MSDELKIDTSAHERVPNTTERIKHTLLALFLGFVFVNIIAFWIFPGIGLGGLYMFSSAHSMVGFVGDLTDVIIVAFLAICGVYGWFRGPYFTDRLLGYIEFWKFW